MIYNIICAFEANHQSQPRCTKESDLRNRSRRSSQGSLGGHPCGWFRQGHCVKDLLINPQNDQYAPKASAFLPVAFEAFRALYFCSDHRGSWETIFYP